MRPASEVRRPVAAWRRAVRQDESLRPEEKLHLLATAGRLQRDVGASGGVVRELVAVAALEVYRGVVAGQMDAMARSRALAELVRTGKALRLLAPGQRPGGIFHKPRPRAGVFRPRQEATP